MPRIVIIGAGPAGITAAYELLKAGGHEVMVLEESEAIGGISRTIDSGGNRMDIGGHRFFSKDKRVVAWWNALMPPQGKPSKDDILLGRKRHFRQEGGADPESEERVMLMRERVSHIYYQNTLFDYPVTLNWNTLKNMGLRTTVRAGFSYGFALLRKLPQDNLENFYVNRFGRVLYSMFFEGYTHKLWGRHPSAISAQWGAQRVKGLSISAVLKHALLSILRVQRRDTETSLIEWFDYPKYGPGQLWEAGAEEIVRMGGRIRTGSRVSRIERDARGAVREVCCADGTVYPCDILISSMPIVDLTAAMGRVPREVEQIARGLPYRGFQTVGVLLPTEKFCLRGSAKVPTVGNIAPDCWIYVQDTSVMLGRIQVFNNWSPYLVKDYQHTVWLGLEFFCDEGDAAWEMDDEAFTDFAVGELIALGVIASRADVLHTHRERVKKAYPAYFDTYADFDTLRGYLDAIPNLYCIGRNGQHRYNNMDHSMLTAFAAVDCIINGADKANVWNVNTEAEYHEANSKAGN